ncbi:carbonate dehydratase [Massilia eurypsychrophila]|uniref:carbonic anhydrase n=1 Tax=Massilia eurypsychrophila TaxID=1485217 RepID=A0A2G8TJ65_9BURK|nr:carbonic anhydrase family protein [Massilia eurypsychrophila]PIL46072.1 carbonate dehydratase [Massilia eurypsychrophila]
MRNLIALFACCFVITTASANDPAPAPAKTAVIPAKSDAAAVAAAVKQAASAPAVVKPAPPLSPAAQRLNEEQAEAELSIKIASRLAEMRAKQAARAAAAARARKLAAVKEKETMLKATVAAAPRHSSTWSYEGENGPANWGKINSEWAKCGTGNRQSPIDLRDGMKVDLEQIAFDYRPSGFNVVDNGHTIQVGLGYGNFITVQNRTFELVQFHFHRPSEERINGRGTEMVVHLVHKDGEGKLAIVAVLLQRGAPNSMIQTVWNNLPLEKHSTIAPVVAIDVNEILPARRDYFTFLGSMTEPPCSEGVLWMVMKEPMPASPAQMALFSRLYPMNARPIQPGGGRVVKESN